MRTAYVELRDCLLAERRNSVLKCYIMAYVRTKEMLMVEAKEMHILELRNTPTNRLCILELRCCLA
jgi:hypothetical protein